jgi:hypothetical protein
MTATIAGKMSAPTEVHSMILGKQQVTNDVPKVIKELQFGVLYGDRWKLKRHILTGTGRTKILSINLPSN